jgi:hypothetical protein
VLTLSIDQGGDGGDGWALDYLTVGVTTQQTPTSTVPEPLSRRAVEPSSRRASR